MAENIIEFRSGAHYLGVERKCAEIQRQHPGLQMIAALTSGNEFPTAGSIEYQGKSDEELRQLLRSVGIG